MAKQSRTRRRKPRANRSRKGKRRKQAGRSKPSLKTTAIVKAEPLSLSEQVEKVLLSGDLTVLSVDERLNYYKTVCKALGLNPFTRPLEYIVLNGKMTLYARKDCTEQLRRLYNVGVIESKRENEGDLCIVTVKVQDKNGKTDIATGAVSVKGLAATDLANAIMKAETKAKRRATLSICGLGFLDESEVEDIDQYGMVSPEGRVMYEAGKEPRFRHGSHEAAQKVLAEKLACHGRLAGSTRPLNAEIVDPEPPVKQPATSKKDSGKIPESEYRKGNVPAATPAEPWKYAGTITFDYSQDKTFPRITGDIAEVIAHFPKDLKLKRKNDFWHCFSEDAERIKQLAVEKNFKIEELLPQQPSSGPPGSAMTTGGKSRGRDDGGVSSSAPVSAVSGFVEQANPESGKSPRMSVLFRIGKTKYWMTAWSDKLFPWLIKAKEKNLPTELTITKKEKDGKTFTNIIGLKSVGSQEFDEDGKTPVIQRKDQEAGGRTLFP